MARRKKNQNTLPARQAERAASGEPQRGTNQLIYSSQFAQSKLTTGPLPSPELLRGYEEVYPGAAGRIIKMAEDEAAHRRQMEAQVIEIQGRDQKSYRRTEIIGQIFGLAIGLTAILGAVFCAVHGAQFAASVIGTTGVTGLVTAFILGRTLLMKQTTMEYNLRQDALKKQAEEQKKIAATASVND